MSFISAIATCAISAIAFSISIFVLMPAAAEPPHNSGAPPKQAEHGFPARVHVFEDFETEIEKRWWLRGEPELKNLAPGMASIPNRRALRATGTKDFDRKMGDQSKAYKAVIFNPVPGPPMGAQTRLSFRYWLKGTDSLRVQIYSLTNNYHRRMDLEALPQAEWSSSDIDLTGARRPDGSGGPLSADERIDDIQFYISAEAELLIDDIVLYEASSVSSPAPVKRPFPVRIIFTGWFDTGEQGKEWPGDFEIVHHERPLTWDAARSVPETATGLPWLRIDLRGERPLGKRNALRFRYRLSKPGPLKLAVARRKDRDVETIAGHSLAETATGQWAEAFWEFEPGNAGQIASEIHIFAPAGSELLVDDLLLFEPGKK